MNTIIRDAKIIDSESPFHNQTVDILIVDGSIKKIGTSLPNTENATEVKLDNLHVSQGCLLYTSPSPRDRQKSRMPSSA
mgnify:CR=1 FL=1